MSCKDCDDNCRQGRDCPYNKGLMLDNLYVFCYNLYNRICGNFTLMEWIVCLASVVYLLSLVI